MKRYIRLAGTLLGLGNVSLVDGSTQYFELKKNLLGHQNNTITVIIKDPQLCSVKEIMFRHMPGATCFGIAAESFTCDKAHKTITLKNTKTAKIRLYIPPNLCIKILVGEEKFATQPEDSSSFKIENNCPRSSVASLVGAAACQVTTGSSSSSEDATSHQPEQTLKQGARRASTHGGRSTPLPGPIPATLPLPRTGSRTCAVC